jgi:hypothetical protein
MWTSYTYTYDDSGLAMMMCTPPGSSGAPNDPGVETVPCKIPRNIYS